MKWLKIEELKKGGGRFYAESCPDTMQVSPYALALKGEPFSLYTASTLDQLSGTKNAVVEME